MASKMTNSITVNEIKINSSNKNNTVVSNSANSNEDLVKIDDNNLNINEQQVCKSTQQLPVTTVKTRPRRRRTKSVQYIQSNGETDEKNQINKNFSACIGKSKVLPSNHKLTEYFSDLKVNDCSINPDNSIEKATIIDKQANNIKENQNNNHLLQSKKKVSRKKGNSLLESNNHKVTEYFPVRRSERKYKKNIIEEKQKDLESKIINEIEDGLKVVDFKGKGRGIVTTKPFHKGDFVIEYIGDLIDAAAAKQRELQYSKNKNIGCYMYYFKHKNIQYCIDATEESGKLGRLINHSRKGNLVSRIVEINQVPRLVLFAKKDIPVDTEVLYDYGDRSRESVRNHPWLNY